VPVAEATAALAADYRASGARGRPEFARRGLPVRQRRAEAGVATPPRQRRHLQA